MKCGCNVLGVVSMGLISWLVYDLRDVFDGTRWIVRTGSSWRIPIQSAARRLCKRWDTLIDGPQPQDVFRLDG